MLKKMYYFLFFILITLCQFAFSETNQQDIKTSQNNNETTITIGTGPEVDSFYKTFNIICQLYNQTIHDKNQTCKIITTTGSITNIINAATITIGTGYEGDSFYKTGNIICKLYNQTFNNKNQTCKIFTTTGSIANINGLVENKFNLALTQADVLFYAYRAVGPFYNKPAQRTLRQLAKLYTLPILVLVRKDSKIDQFSQLLNKRINIGPKQSNAETTFTAITIAEQTNVKKFKEVSHLDNSQAIKALCENKLDALFVLANKNGIDNLGKTCPVRVISLNDPNIKRLIKYGPYHRYPIADNFTPQQHKKVMTIATDVVLTTTQKLPYKTAEQIIKLLLSNIPILQKTESELQNINKKHMFNKRMIPIYKGLLNKSHRD